MTADQDFRAWPKIDLHRHLEGSIRPETFFEIAQTRGIELPAQTLEEIRPFLQIADDPPDFPNFLGKFKLLSCFWPDREAIERVSYEAVEDAAHDNVVYLELRYAPVHFARGRGFKPADVIEWVHTAARRAAGDRGIRVEFIACAGRHFPMEINVPGIEAVLEAGPEEFVGFDIAGDEINFPLDPFAPWLERIKESGLGLTLHAGEAGPAENVREAMARFDADRIGHGVRITDDESLVEMAVERGTGFEMCLTSNVQTATVPSLQAHPARSLLTQGVCVTLNSDDPQISRITLSDEFKAASESGFSSTELKAALANSVKSAFLNESDRNDLQNRLNSYHKT
ncbi:MAG: adenosine deaminase [Planctomycetota bacterium]|nr:adenosine deaminase [Planctomycetota bacterium]MDA1141530.1 adenosine deaminase [Planctomycetota bacterium]